jgi:hypothetical protein
MILILKIVKISASRCTFTVSGSNPMSISWGGHKKLAAGCTFGAVVVWNMEKALVSNEKIFPEQSKRLVQLSVLPFDATVSNISWNGVKNPERLLASAYDGRIKIIDTNDPSSHYLIIRLRGVAKAIAWPNYNGPCLFMDNDGNCRGMGITEEHSNIMMKYMDTPGFCWDIGTSEHHGTFALATSLGWLKTSNAFQARSKSLVNQ